MFDFSKTKTTREEMKLISSIKNRACKADKEIEPINLDMDLTATHHNNPLRLSELLNADSFNFCHDVYGIMQNINRDTGKLENCFLPRFTA